MMNNSIIQNLDTTNSVRLYVSNCSYESPVDFFKQKGLFVKAFIVAQGHPQDFLTILQDGEYSLSFAKETSFQVSVSDSCDPYAYFKLDFDTNPEIYGAMFDTQMFIEDCDMLCSYGVEGMILHQGSQWFFTKNACYIQTAQKLQIVIYIA